MNKKNTKWFILTLVIAGVGVYTYLMIIPKTTIPEEDVRQLGQDLQLIAEPTKPEFILGEPIDIILRIRNIKSEPIVVLRLDEKTLPYAGMGFSLTGEIERPWCFLWSRKRIVKLSMGRSMLFMPKKDHFIQLEPGEDIVIDVHFDSPIHRKYGSGNWEVEASAIGRIIDERVRDDILKECFSRVGEYTIKFTLEIAIDKYLEFLDDKGRAREIKVNAWTGKVSSNKLKIKIVQGNG